MKKGLKVWKERAEKAITKELGQLHYCDTFEPVVFDQLEEEERKKIIESHLFLKQKCDESIKGQMVGGGNTQRGYIDKEDASSPTVSLEAVLLTSVIDAQEERDIVTIDIPNAFIQTRLKDKDDMVVM